MLALRRLVPAVALAFLAGTPGCYTYAVVPVEGILPGEDVRVLLAPAPGADAFTPVGGVQPGTAVEGQLLSREDGAFMLYVPTATRHVGFHEQVLNQRVRIAEASVLALERRELDRGRTGVLLAGLAAGVGALAWNALGGEAGGPTATPPGDGTSNLRRPFGVRIPLGPGGG